MLSNSAFFLSKRIFFYFCLFPRKVTKVTQVTLLHCFFIVTFFLRNTSVFLRIIDKYRQKNKELLQKPLVEKK